jgi:hypothetical protein
MRANKTSKKNGWREKAEVEELLLGYIAGQGESKLNARCCNPYFWSL